MQNKSIENILISVGYDDINKPNISELDIHPKWVLNTKNDLKKYLTWTQFEKYWGNKLHTFETNTLDYFYLNNIKFIYPITLYSTDLFIKYKTMELSDILLKCIKNKKAKIIFFYTTEGDWGSQQFHFNWINDLIDKYNLNNDDILVITTNLKAKDNYIDNKFNIIPYNFFADDLEFLKLKKTDKYSLKAFEEHYIKYIKNNRNNKKKKHFLCFNGIPRLNRLLIFGSIKSNLKLNNTTILSLRNTQSENPNEFYEEVIKHSDNKKIIDFFKTYNSTINYSYDTNNWDKIYSWGNFLNMDVHTNSFINIVTETMWNKESIFFTEKIYKPIYMCQPFILFGNPNSLKKLKEYGFKTFDKWWDESYDNEFDLNIRLEKITKILEEIASWDFDKCFDITNQMEEVLVHNYKQMISTDELYKIYTLLQTDTKLTKKSII
jgi:hypothetical protein